MSAANLRTDQLETRYELLRLDLANLKNQLAKIQSDLANQQVGQWPMTAGGTTTVWTIAPDVISAGSSAASQIVYSLQGGSSVALPGTYTVYNQMAQPTVATAGKTIMVGANGDGTFSVITQSC